MPMTRQERISLHKKQERLQVKDGEPILSEMDEDVPVLRTTSEGLVQYVRHNGVLYQQILDKTSGSDIAINNYTITWTANEPTTSSTNTIDDGNTVGDDNEGGQAIADLTAKVNGILNVLRVRNIIK